VPDADGLDVPSTELWVPVIVRFSDDWMNLIAVTHECALPNSKVATDILCFKCGFTTRDKKQGWYLDGSFFRDYMTRTAAFGNSPLFHIRMPLDVLYDPLHMMGRVTDNVIIGIYVYCKSRGLSLFCRRFTLSMSRVIGGKKWNKDKSLKVRMRIFLVLIFPNFQPKHAKLFWSGNTDQLLLQHLADDPQHVLTEQVVLHAGAHRVALTVLECVRLLLEAARFSYTWLHVESVSACVVEWKQHFRDQMLSIMEAFAMNMNPAVHYWLEHALEDALSYPLGPWFYQQEQVCFVRNAGC
jgi:hypothetical protein